MNTKRLISAVAAGLAVAGLAFAGPAQAKVEGDTIILGSAISFTGKYSTNGIHAKNGYDIGVAKINSMGGVKVGGKSYKLKIQYYDDESTPLRTAQLLERLVNQDGVKYFLGPYSSATTKAAAPIIEKYKVPMIEAEGASRSLFNKGYKYLFAVLSTSEQYLASSIGLAAEIAEKNGKKPSEVKIAMAFENDPFSLDVRAGVLEDAKKYGMKVVIDDKMPRDLNDISSTLTKVKALKPDLLLLSGHSKGAATGARQIKEMKIDVPMIALTHCEAAKITTKFGASTNDFLCPTQWAPTLTYKDKYFGTAADYDKEFKKTFDGYKNVPYQSAQATASVLVWKDAFERANSLDPEKVRDAIAATDMETFYGGIKFAPEGNNIAKPMVLRQIQNGEYNVVAPSKWASHPVNWPRKAQ
ncbi:MAG: amino acid ABC transporter substrate-binding protein [Rhodospirillaceae bacterium]|nr:amino acid ABC transporter substrate-binding protein [Magnetovibrio sp.]MAY66808.1 amino acid ABC transporter substrate-binding protein [Rhodospirillaceae bacterium]